MQKKNEKTLIRNMIFSNLFNEMINHHSLNKIYFTMYRQAQHLTKHFLHFFVRNLYFTFIEQNIHTEADLPNLV